MATQTLTAFPDDSRTYQFDYSPSPEIVNGEKLVATGLSVTSIPAGVTVGAKTVNVPGTMVSVILSGGTAGTVYKIYCVAHTDLGSVIAVEGELAIMAP